MLSGNSVSQISRKSAPVGGKLSALHTGPSYIPGNIPGNHSSYGLSRPQSHSAAGRLKSMKNPSGAIGNRTCGIPACSGVPHTTVLPRGKWAVHTIINRVQRTYCGGLKCH